MSTPSGQDSVQGLSRERILHLWDTHVGDPTALRPLVDDDKVNFARAVEADALASSVSKPEASLLSHAELLRELCACSDADPGRGRSNEGRWVAVNVPRELWDRVNVAAGAAEVAKPAVQQSAPQADSGTLAYARNLAVSLHRNHYSEIKKWRPLGDVLGLLTQIDNMVSGLVRATPTSPTPAEATEEDKAVYKAIADRYFAEAPAGQGDVFGDEEHVLVPRGLLGAACSTIDKKRDGTKTLAELRRYTVGDLSTATPLPAQVQPAEQVGEADFVPRTNREIAAYNCGLAKGIDIGAALAQQSAEAKEPKLIGWRTSDYLYETTDRAMAKNWEPNVGVLPIFEGDPNTKLTAALPGKGEGDL